MGVEKYVNWIGTATSFKRSSIKDSEASSSFSPIHQSITWNTHWATHLIATNDQHLHIIIFFRGNFPLNGLLCLLHLPSYFHRRKKKLVLCKGIFKGILILQSIFVILHWLFVSGRKKKSEEIAKEINSNEISQVICWHIWCFNLKRIYLQYFSSEYFYFNKFVTKSSRHSYIAKRICLTSDDSSMLTMHCTSCCGYR